MKMSVLTSIVAVLATASAAVSDTSCRIVANHSGSVWHTDWGSGNNSYSLDSGDVEYCYWVSIYPYEVVLGAGYVGFDLADIPDKAQIQAATIFFYQYYDTFTTPRVTPVVIDHRQWTAESVWAALRGPAVGAEVTCQPGWSQAAFDPTGLSVLKASLPPDSVFFGLTCGGNVSEGIAYGCAAPESLRPYLRVDYLPPGVEDSPQLGVSSHKPLPTIIRGVLYLPRDMTEIRSVIPDRVPRPVLLDATGRMVLDLHPGANNVSRLAPGVYFYRLVAGENTATRKMVKAE